MIEANGFCPDTIYRCDTQTISIVNESGRSFQIAYEGGVDLPSGSLLGTLDDLLSEATSLVSPTINNLGRLTLDSPAKTALQPVTVNQTSVPTGEKWHCDWEYKWVWDGRGGWTGSWQKAYCDVMETITEFIPVPNLTTGTVLIEAAPYSYPGLGQ